MNDSDRLAYALKGLSVLRHDVRNLLASVEILAERMAKSEDQRLAKAGPMLLDQMRRTVALGVAAGELASIAGAEAATVDLSEAARQGLASEEIASGVETADLDGHTVRADPGHVTRMLGAIAVNGLALADEGQVAFEAAREGDTVRVTARCAGQVPDYAKEKLLEPYGGAKRRGGTGLGLPIARLLAEENGGTLTLEETSETGTVFALVLPAV